MTQEERIEYFLRYFTANSRSEVTTELQYDTPFQLLVAVILSAQCTDKRVNSITPALFDQFPSPIALGTSTFEDVFPYIKSISYPNNKTKHLIKMAHMLVHDFNSIVPDNIIDLQKLPGVGRKTANVIAAIIYHQPALAVDTHVFKVATRLGLVSQHATTSLAIEKELTERIPLQYIPHINHWLVLHGRYICLAQNPKCAICPLSFFCDYFYRKNKSF